jgi:hypothetical protein
MFRHAIVIGALIPGISLLHAQAPVRPHVFQQVAEPPVPTDPLELITGDAQPVTDVNQRAQIMDLLDNAHRISNVRAQPYDLKTTFAVSGSLSAGQWQEEDIFPGGGLYRWNAEGPGYSAVNLTAKRIFYSSQPSAVLPLRLMQVRESIFRPEPVVGPRATLRTANASLNGADLVCVLLAHNALGQAATGGRRWEEAEYCVDPKTGALVTFSQAPGVYVRYDYSKALQFHGKLIPNSFTISQAGQTIIEAQTESVADPVANPAAFQATGLNQIGVGAVMSLAAWESRVHLPLPGNSQNAPAQVVELHAMQSPGGQLSDVELLASSDASLNPAALAFVSNWQGGMMGQDAQTGATPQSHEVVITLQYAAFQAPTPAE